jgi:hypothetical protein
MHHLGIIPIEQSLGGASNKGAYRGALSVHNQTRCQQQVLIQRRVDGVQ